MVYQQKSSSDVDLVKRRAPPAPTCTELLAKTLPRHSLFNTSRTPKRRRSRSGQLTVILPNKQDESETTDTHHARL